jgi:hypothetical protein
MVKYISNFSSMLCASCHREECGSTSHINYQLKHHINPTIASRNRDELKSYADMNVLEIVLVVSSY